MNVTGIGHQARAKVRSVHTDRRLPLALTLSLVVHALVLVFGRTPPALPERPVLQASLRADVPVAVAPLKPVVSHQPPQPEKRDSHRPSAPTSVHPTLLAPQPVLAVQNKAAPTQTAPASPPSPPAAAAMPAVAVDSKASAPARGQEAPVGAAPEVGASVADVNGVRQLRLALSAAMAGHKFYPRLARERGWQGEVQLRLSIYGDGRPVRIQVAHSCGHGILDEQARDMAEKAYADTPLPASLRGRDFSLPLTVAFSLDDE